MLVITVGFKNYLRDSAFVRPFALTQIKSRSVLLFAPSERVNIACDGANVSFA